MRLIDKAWSMDPDSVGDTLESPENGLSRTEVEDRRGRYGPNRVQKTERRSSWSILWDQFKEPIIWLLVAAAALSFSFGNLLEGVSIMIAILVNGVIGFTTEWKATRSMEALFRMGEITSKVYREGSLKSMPAVQLVPGDRVALEAGDLVPADLRLYEASRLQVDESSLTGESVNVGKGLEPLPEETPLAERTSMAFKGTAVTAGSGKGIVTAIGANTEIGRIETLAKEAEEEESPLEKRLGRLATRLIWVTLGIAAAVAVSGFFTDLDLFLIVETSIALAVAAIPEGLPIVATIALARGMWRMAEHNAVMNRLSAVETLGATSVIFTDKTGTLTENRMVVREYRLVDSDEGKGTPFEFKREEGRFVFKGRDVDPSENPTLHDALLAGVLCNNAELSGDAGEADAKVGDPMEVALLEAARAAGMERRKVLESLPEEREAAFDPERMMMATFHRTDEGGSYRIAIKGAPEAVLGASDGLDPDTRSAWSSANEEMARDGLRVLALAERFGDSLDEDPYEGMRFLGLVGLLDPPRSDVGAAVSECRNAGIRVIMVTGDQPVTARHVGESLGLLSSDGSGTKEVVHGKDLSRAEDLTPEQRERFLQAPIFARVSPEQKLDLIALHQQSGAVVAMTGDGVNDAPALKKADIGVAMGRRGTQVAQEASDMILKDDAFRSIVVAVEQGRAIFDNIRKFIVFLLSGNVGEIMIVALALLFGAPLPLLPLQILYLNMLVDVFPALALGIGKGDALKMENPPRDSKEPILTNAHWLAIVGYGALIAAPVLTAFFAALHGFGMPTGEAVTVSFLTLAFARLWHAFNMKDPGTGVLRNDITRNPYVWGALGLCVVLIVLGIYLPWLSTALKMVPPDGGTWGFILGMSLVPWMVGQAILTPKRERG